MTGAHGLIVLGIVFALLALDATTVGSLVRLAAWLERRRRS
jgi:hypothetical protein